MAFTITAANAVLMLGVAGVYPTAQQIQGFAVDDAFEAEMAEITVAQVGVDNFGVAGWVPREIKTTIMLMASSGSFVNFENWITAMDIQQEVLYANMTLVIPSVQRKYTMLQGSLTRYAPIPNLKRTLQQRSFEITWLPQGPGLPAITAGPA